jgi:hypothetical protein
MYILGIETSTKAGSVPDPGSVLPRSRDSRLSQENRLDLFPTMSETRSHGSEKTPDDYWEEEG